MLSQKYKPEQQNPSFTPALKGKVGILPDGRTVERKVDPTGNIVTTNVFAADFPDAKPFTAKELAA